MIGRTLRDYRIVTELGSGGMGTVYYAEHNLIGRRAAIKVLNPEIASSQELVGRFFTEAKTVNAIRHPNIVDVTDFGCEGGQYFIVMEFLEGETLGARLERIACFEEPAALRLLAQVCSAVGAVHEQGIVHRDLKSENIFLTNHRDYPDFVKVLDFGVVKLAPGASADALKSTPGLVIGTPAFMSPEQCVGDGALDHRSDIYSVGVVAYQMLTGKLPFSGTAFEQMHAHTKETPPPLRQLNARLSEATEAIIARTLAKRPQDRFESIRKLREHLEAVLAGRPLPLPAQAPAEPRAPGPPAPPPLKLVPPVEAAPTAEEAAQRAEVERCQTVNLAGKLEKIISRRLSQNTLKLPAMPAVALKALELLRDPGSSFAAVAATLETDPLVSARILRVVNSPAYGGRSKIPGIEAAVSRLGIRPLRTLLQEQSAEEVFSSRNPRIRAAFKGIWEHCLAVAQLSRALARALGKGADPESAYLAGLFHDVGKPIVAVVLLEAERTLAGESEWVSDSVWLKAVNACHREVGASLATAWHLPQEVISTISRLGEYDYRHPHSCTNVVRLANAISKREGIYAGVIDDDEALGAILKGRQLLRVTDELEERVTAELRKTMTSLEEGLTLPGATAR